MLENAYKNTPIITASGIPEWRKWLMENFEKADAVWLVIFHKSSAIDMIYYNDAVDEALCFGWIDSKINKRDEVSFYQYFSKRNPKSNWSKVNKEKVERLLVQNRMAQPGLEMISLAKKTGTWDALNDVDNLVIPPDMMLAFQKKAMTLQHWTNFPNSIKRGILEWIINAKTQLLGKKE